MANLTLTHTYNVNQITCDYTNFRYISWRNRFGGFEFDLFSANILEKSEQINRVDYMANQSEQLQNQNKRDIIYYSENQKTLELSKNAISYSNKDRYLDLIKALNSNIWLLNKKYYLPLSLTAGSKTIVSANHGLLTGDQVLIAGTLYYVSKINDNEFEINTAAATTETVAGYVKLSDKNWLHCQGGNVDTNINQKSKQFFIRFLLNLPKSGDIYA